MAKADPSYTLVFPGGKSALGLDVDLHVHWPVHANGEFLWEIKEFSKVIGHTHITKMSAK